MCSFTPTFVPFTGFKFLTHILSQIDTPRLLRIFQLHFSLKILKLEILKWKKPPSQKNFCLSQPKWLRSGFVSFFPYEQFIRQLWFWQNTFTVIAQYQVCAWIVKDKKFLGTCSMELKSLIKLLFTFFLAALSVNHCFGKVVAFSAIQSFLFPSWSNF